LIIWPENLKEALVPTDDLPKISTLNPHYLQAVRDEAAIKRKAVQAANLVSAPALIEAKAESDLDALAQADSFGRFRQGEPNASDETERVEDGMREPPGTAVAWVKAAIASRQAEIDQTQQQLDRLNRIKATVEPAEPLKGRANLNELRMRRLAIQMGLLADSKEYDEDDLLAVDKQIAQLKGLTANKSPLEAPAHPAERMKLSADIDGLQSRLAVLSKEINTLIANHNLSVAVAKAEDYVNALTNANTIRHELLALAELLDSDGLLMNMGLGGELPLPSGFYPFDALLKETLATSIEGIEEAKARILTEVIL
jgi:hypothetical protein